MAHFVGLDDPAPRRPLEPWQRLVAGLFGLGFSGLIAADLIRSGEAGAMSVVFILLAWFPLLVWHELGHALAALAVGWHVHEVVVGVGTPLARLRVGRTRILLRLIPVSGYVIPIPDSPERARLKQALVYFGGPGSELMLAGAVVLAIGPDVMLHASSDLWVIGWQSLAVAALMGAVMNLVPIPLQGAVTDGLGILLSPTLEREHFESQAILPHVLDMEAHLDAGDAASAQATVQAGLQRFVDNLTLAGLLCVARAANGELEQAMEALEALRDRPDMTDEEDAHLLYCAARVVLESGDGPLLGDAESAIRSAMERIGSELTYRLTLGRLQIEQGRHNQALDTLMVVYKEARRPELEDRCLAYLCIAHHGAGHQAEAALFQRELLSRKPTPQLAARVATQLTAERDASGTPPA